MTDRNLAGLSLMRHAYTEWMIAWLRSDDLQDALQEIRFVHAMLPHYDRRTAIRMTALGHLGVIPLPEGSRLEFVVRSIEAMIGLVDWARVEEELYRE